MTLHDFAIHIHHNHVLRLQFFVGDTGGFDDNQIIVCSLGDISPCKDDETAGGKLAVRALATFFYFCEHTVSLRVL